MEVMGRPFVALALFFCAFLIAAVVRPALPEGRFKALLYRRIEIVPTAAPSGRQRLFGWSVVCTVVLLISVLG